MTNETTKLDVTALEGMEALMWREAAARIVQRKRAEAAEALLVKVVGLIPTHDWDQMTALSRTIGEHLAANGD